MRLTIIFLLVACNLGLTFWAWTLTFQRMESIPQSSEVNKMSAEVEKINGYTDIERLREHARHLVSVVPDEKAYARDIVTGKAMNIIGIVVLITVVVLILLFLEI